MYNFIYTQGWELFSHLSMLICNTHLVGRAVEESIEFGHHIQVHDRLEKEVVMTYSVHVLLCKHTNRRCKLIGEKTSAAEAAVQLD